MHEGNRIVAERKNDVKQQKFALTGMPIYQSGQIFAVDWRSV